MEILFVIFFVIFIVAFVFLVCRKVMLWYWKVNNIIDLLSSIDRKVSAKVKLPNVENSEVDELEESADLKAQKGSYEAAIEDLLEALGYRPNSSGIHFNLACLYSLEKNKELSLRHLQRAVECGFTDYEMIVKEPELVYLRLQPEFREFVVNGYKC